MGTNLVNPENILEIIKRSKLYNPNFPLGRAGLSDQASPQISQSQFPTQQQSQFQPQQQVQQPQQPSAPSALDQAASEYRQAIKGMPTLAKYHPSMLRKVTGALVGGISGAGDPKFGSQAARGIVYGPFQRDLSDYERRLAGKKEAYETESTTELASARTEEQKAQKRAEESRSGSEEASKERQLAETRGLRPGTPEFEGKTQLLKIQYPGTPKINPNELYRIPLKNGETVLGSRGVGGQFYELGSNTPLGENTYDASEVVKVGPTLPKESVEKPHNEYNDFYAGMKLKNPKMTDDEISAAYKKIAPAERTAPAPIVIDASGKVVALRPGMDAPQGFETPTQKGQETEGTAQTREMAEFAPKVSSLVDRVSALVDAQIKTLGPAASRWSEYWAGRVGTPNPEFTKLRTDTMLLQTLLMRMHTGSRGSNYMINHFKELIDFGKQSPENMKAALGEIKRYTDEIVGTKKSQGPKTKEDFLRLLEKK